MNATTLPAEIIAFAAAVRASLRDLPADEVEELTDGLEADLAEAYAEDLARELPDPAAYAAELRGAAGLPTPEPVVKQGRLRPIVDGFAETLRDLDRSLRKSPVVAGVLDFLVTLQPAWWIVRGWAAYQVLGGIFGFEGDLLPTHPGYWILMLVLVAGSVAVGLRRWRPWVHALIIVGNIVAAIATLAAMASIPTNAEVWQAWQEADQTYYDDSMAAGPDGTGVWLNGSEVTNIHAYDAKGQPLNGVQLFDQDGKPLATSVPGGNGCLVPSPVDEDGCQTFGAWVPTQLETGATVWNVYPMKMAESTEDEPTTPIAGAVPQDRPAPFVKVPALMRAEPVDADAPKVADPAKKEAEKTP
ncbi:hypothetical protein AFL01nite_21690 [Aeromicrobium flavum]|uniref:Uncharacterized protein n=1 Tax=Aeromicrobium flavum TaxID=416568 RepID=A0A512HWM1_9ACTN|nr:hypothetical protein [Aeromicrobium flavum]GEO89842.1 hypothetical protein AFL01nite_21690 [Aeromicrobium flavum]